MELAAEMTTTPGPLAGVVEANEEAGLLQIEYSDGFLLSMLLVPGCIVPDGGAKLKLEDDGAGGFCGYAARTKQGDTHGCEFFLQPNAVHAVSHWTRNTRAV